MEKEIEGHQKCIALHKLRKAGMKINKYIMDGDDDSSSNSKDCKRSQALPGKKGIKRKKSSTDVANFTILGGGMADLGQ